MWGGGPWHIVTGYPIVHDKKEENPRDIGYYVTIQVIHFWPVNTSKNPLEHQNTSSFRSVSDHSIPFTALLSHQFFTVCGAHTPPHCPPEHNRRLTEPLFTGHGLP